MDSVNMTALMVVGLLLFGMAASLKSLTVWKPEHNQNIVSFLALTQETSDINCVRMCSRFTHCARAAYDVTSGVCYLHPKWSDGGDLTVYEDVDAICLEEDAPVVNKNVTWLRTLTSLESMTPVEPLCPEDYIHSIEATLMSCLATGQWETQEGQCNQRIWRNKPQGQYPVPRTPLKGWRVCMNATPTATDLFNIDFLDADLNYVFHMNGRMNTVHVNRSIVMSANMDGNWDTYRVELRDLGPRFPFVTGQQFQMELKAAEDDRIQLYVNGDYYGSSQQLPATVDTVTRVGLYQLHITMLDLWCV